MNRLTTGQRLVLILTATPVVAIGFVGATATYVNMKSVLPSSATALGMVAAGEGSVFILAMAMLAMTMMGQTTPLVIRSGLWLIPAGASASGAYLAPNDAMSLVMAASPMAMTASAEVVSLVARRIVTHRTGVDPEARRLRSKLLWHANRASSDQASRPARYLSRAAVWRLTRKVSEMDESVSETLAAVLREKISQGADEKLASVLGGTTATAVALPATPKPVAALPVAEPATPEPVASLPVAAEPLPVAAEPLPVAEPTPDLIGSFDAPDPDGVAEYLTAADVAVLLKKSPATIRSMVHRGTLSVAAKDENGRNLFSVKDIQNLA